MAGGAVGDGAQMGKHGGEAVSPEDDFRARQGNQGPLALRAFQRLLWASVSPSLMYNRE